MKLKALQLVALLLFCNIVSFAQSENTEPPAVNYGKTVIAVAPLSLTEISKGVGLSYERALDKEGIIALWVPVSFGFRSYDNNYSNNNSSTIYGNFYAMPGIKIYPTGSFGKCKYSIGPNLVFTTGSKSTGGYYDYNSGMYFGGETVKFFRMGFMVNNSLNVNPLPHLYLGLDFGFGITYVNQQDDVNGSAINEGSSGLVHFAFRVGYRN